MYPVCAEDCSQRCAGISAAIGYARRYGADEVVANLREAEEECRRLRQKDDEPKSRKKSKRGKSVRFRSRKRSSRRRRR